jgi:hypothetical protein
MDCRVLVEISQANNYVQKKKETPLSESASELYRRSDRHLLAKKVPTFEDRGVSRGQRDVSLRPYWRFSRPKPLLLFQVAPQLYSQGWVDPVPRPTTTQKIWQRREPNPDLRICSQELWPLDHRGGQLCTDERKILKWSWKNRLEAVDPSHLAQDRKQRPIECSCEHGNEPPCEGTGFPA